MHGISYWFTYVSLVIVIFVSYKVFVPVFANLKTPSSFEYLKRRYDTKTRMLGSMLYLISAILYLPVVMYMPSLALSQATGMNIHLINILVCTVCIFYTSVGGLKAVVYSDALQTVIMIGALVIAFILGVVRCGGFENVWNTSYEHNRLKLKFDIDFTLRNAFWAVTFGQFMTWLSFLGVSQVYIQKCLAIPSEKDVIKVLTIFALGIFVIGSLCNFTGLIMFTEYSNCDPVKSGILEKQDQLLPYYILDISKQLPGLAGLFIAGIFGAALSTLAGMLNSLSCTIFEDFISKYIPKNTTQLTISRILKLIVLIIGIVATGLVFVVEKLGGMLALSLSLSGITAGPILALFVGGMLIPKMNEKGAYYGSVTSLILMTIIVFGSQYYQNSGYLTTVPLPTSIEGCTFLNSTITQNYDFKIDGNSTSHTINEVPYIFRVPFYWYCTIGFVFAISLGLLISHFSKSKKNIDKELFSPVIYRFLSRNSDETIYVSEKLMESK
ncbi:sodium-coupled monocarboxylate transporter 2-like isoform X2 [Onthophagus taurus]|nr:sodium-coupled monocarboxylate transporter 2-like isoform X2 [Onthophagus taurus]